jgi:DNA-binding PadR family transcriptional regulator
MEPIKRLTSSVSEGNLWIYILSLGKEQEIPKKDITRLIFEKFGFLPSDLIVRTVLFRLENDGYASREKFKGEKAYKITEKGIKELEAAKTLYQSLLQKI